HASVALLLMDDITEYSQDLDATLHLKTTLCMASQKRVMKEQILYQSTACCTPAPFPHPWERQDTCRFPARRTLTACLRATSGVLHTRISPRPERRLQRWERMVLRTHSSRCFSQSERTLLTLRHRV